MQANSARTRTLLAIALFVLGLLLRLPGIGWGLKNEFHNQSYHPDEAVIFAYAQQIEPAKLKFTPGFYNYGTLYLTLLRVASDMTAAYTGGVTDKSTPGDVWAFVSRVHVAGRFMSALAGAGAAVVLFLVLWKFTSPIGAGAGGIAMAIAPGSVIHSHFQTVDILAMFFLAVGTLFALKFQGTDSPAQGRAGYTAAALSGAFFGLSAGTKYSGILGVLTLFAALYLSQRKDWMKEAAVGVVATFVAFVVTTPGFLLDSQRFWRDFNYERIHTATGHGLLFVSTSNGFIFHLGNLFVGIGILLTLLGLMGLIMGAIRKERWIWALLAFFVPYAIVIGGVQVKFLRYTLPLYIGVAAGFGYLMGEAQRERRWGRIATVAGVLAIGGIDTGGATGAARALVWMIQPDPRDQAAAFIKGEARNRPDMLAGMPSDPWYWSVPLFPNTTDSRAVPFEKRMEDMRAASHPRVTYYVPPDGDRHAFDVRLLTELHPDVVPMTSLEAGPVARLADVPDLPPDARIDVDRYKEFAAKLSSDYSAVKIFGEPAPPVEDIQYIQPQVVVWERKQSR